jgi:phosphoenolpyruvate carboxykinase (GTP)
MSISPADLARVLSIDAPRWRAEMAHRERHLAQFGGLPEEIWAAHRRVAAALEALGG